MPGPPELLVLNERAPKKDDAVVAASAADVQRLQHLGFARCSS
jgi:hypothetical protein